MATRRSSRLKRKEQSGKEEEVEEELCELGDNGRIEVMVTKKRRVSKKKKKKNKDEEVVEEEEEQDGLEVDVDLGEYVKPFWHWFNDPEGGVEWEVENDKSRNGDCEDVDAWLLELPTEVILNLCKFLNVHDTGALMMSCGQLYEWMNTDALLWQQMAERSYGEFVLGLEGVDDWKQWMIHRMTTKRCLGSPLDFIQEYYSEDPWMVLCCCLLVSRTNGGSTTIRSCIASFFENFASPTDVIAGDFDSMITLIRPLGMSDDRIVRCKRTCQAFLEDDWESVTEFYGCGGFAEDSVRVFCKGGYNPNQCLDRNVKQFARWAQKMDRNNK